MLRAFDLIIAISALVFFAPIMTIVAIVVKLEDGGPILFGHKRVGEGGQSFKCLKFRSMRTNAAELLRNILETDPAARAEWDQDQKLRNDPRVTRVGDFIRRWSLDELPQLFNVVRGEMSIVGPRPIVEAEMVRYGRYIRNYTNVTPGITGMWQVFGRNDVSYEQRVIYDVFFSRRRSVALYIKLLVMTIPAVLLKKGSY
jgi:exopolysaccharide production protein ExoY